MRRILVLSRINDRFQKARHSPFRHFVWPVRSHELYKFAPMALLMFCILLNQNLIRNLKDSIVMTLIGAEAISFIKLWLEMPAGILFVLAYSKMCNIMTTEKAFRYIVAFFLSFFALFAYVFFPNMHFFHPSEQSIQYYLAVAPNLKWFIILWGKWSVALFYVMGELWPVIIFSVLYWQLSNKITKTDEASRFYPFFSFFGQSNLLLSGVVIIYFSSGQHFLVDFFPRFIDKTELLVKSQVTTVLLLGLIILAIHRHVERKVILAGEVNDKAASKPLKLSMRESIQLIISSRYLGLIFVLIVAYGTTVILIEGVWMNKVRELYSSPSDFASYQGKVLFCTGIFTLICSFIGSTVLRYIGWFWGAIVTPIMFTFVGGAFFLLVTLQHKLEYFISHLPYLSPLALIVLLGGLQNVLGKGTKYSLFDSTKEMAYIPLNNELKTKGKAAADVLGMKMGKSLGSLVQFVTFTLYPAATYDDITGFLMVIFLITCVIWLYGVRNLAAEYNALVAK